MNQNRADRVAGRSVHDRVSSTLGSDEKIEIDLHDLHPEPEDMRGDILRGLRDTPKTLPCKYFYDQKGSQLFDAICHLDEYYPTRTEVGILERYAPDMAEIMGKGSLLIELGSGSSTKTPLLLDALDEPAAYVPVDISREHLMDASNRIKRSFGDLLVKPVCADFTVRIELPELPLAPKRRHVFFPGSTMGNFDPENRRRLLQQIVALCQPEGGGLLIGLDLLKKRETLEAAYNDARGITAAFNLNLLERINRELGGQFDLNRFSHDAPFNSDAGRIEMHLVSDEDQVVDVGNESFAFSAGERICTEHSYKFDIDEFTALAEGIGLTRRAVWTDEDDLFAVILLDTHGGSEDFPGR